MLGKTHKVGGICSGVILGTLFLREPYTADKVILVGLIILGAWLGSLIPDIDHQNSIIGQRLRGLSKIFSTLFKHRGFTHAPIIHILIFSILVSLSNKFSGFLQMIYLALIIGIFIGVMSHILLDFMTVSGIPLLYPFSQKRYRIAKFKTSKHESIVRVFIVVLTVFICKYLLF